MKHFSQMLILAALTVTTATAQGQSTLRQQSFPVSLPVEDDNIEWQRDVYRELNLQEDENAGLYSPAEPSVDQRGLFTKLFNLALENRIPIYRYNMDGNEVFNEVTRIDIRNVLINHHILFREKDGHIIVDNSDMPSPEVTAYYLKESVYYDLTNSAFRIRVQAVCPVLIQEDELTGEPTKYPLFWVEYKCLEPYLKDLSIIPNYRNRALVVPMTDYFTLNMYKGDVYMEANPFGKTMRQTVESDSALVREQQRIDKEMKMIRKTTYNTYYEDYK